MSEKNCSFCGILIHTYQDYCETCTQMMGVSNDEPIFEATEMQTAQPDNIVAPVLMRSVQDVTEPPTESIQSNQVAATGFSPNYARPPLNTALPNSSATVSNYKPGVLDWFWELPTIVKLGIALAAFFLVFGFVLKLFMGLDVSIAKGEIPVNVEAQKPWFSAWLRSNPTVEEIFEKYEKETSAKGKTLTAQSYYLTGNVQLIQGFADGTVDLNFLYKNKGTSTKSTVQGEMSFYNGTFEVYLQHPNKWVLKAATNVSQSPLEKRAAPLTVGFDGTKISGIAKKPTTNGGFVNEDLKTPNTAFFINSTASGISLAFQNSLYPKTELAGEDIVFNRRAYNVKAKNVFGDETTLAFDIENGLLTKITQKDLTMFVIDHKDFDGVLYPAKFIFKVNNIWMMLSIEKMQPDAVFSPAVFLQSSF